MLWKRSFQKPLIRGCKVFWDSTSVLLGEKKVNMCLNYTFSLAWSSQDNDNPKKSGHEIGHLNMTIEKETTTLLLIRQNYSLPHWNGFGLYPVEYPSNSSASDHIILKKSKFRFWNNSSWYSKAGFDTSYIETEDNIDHYQATRTVTVPYESGGETAHYKIDYWYDTQRSILIKEKGHYDDSGSAKNIYGEMESWSESKDWEFTFVEPSSAGDNESSSSGGSTPGFEALYFIGALSVSYIILYHRRRKP